MARTYTATLQIRCWKRHKCIGCDGTYAYEFVRKIVGTGRTAAAASAKAEVNKKKVLADDTDLHPCPTCGLYQPDMIGQRRARRGWVVFWCALLAFGLSLILASTYALQYNVVTWAVTATCALAAGVLWMTALWNPNRDVSANLARATEAVAKGRLLHQIGQRSARLDSLAHPSMSPIQRIVLLLLIAAVAAAAMPEIVRTMRNWPLNPDAYPPVVGPGDQTRIYMVEQIDSIKNYWRGQADVQLRDGNHSSQASATTNQNDWGSTIMAKSSEKHSSSTPWVEVTVPADPSLAGKSIACDITLNVQYPFADAAGTFNVLTNAMHRTVNLTLAPPGAGADYLSRWWQGTLAGMGLVLFCSAVLIAFARALRRQANPTEVFAVPATAPK